MGREAIWGLTYPIRIEAGPGRRGRDRAIRREGVRGLSACRGGGQKVRYQRVRMKNILSVGPFVSLPY